MTCTVCDRPTVAFAVPEELRACVPENAPAAAVCASCLTLQPPMPDELTPEDPDLTRVSNAFPADSVAAVPMALAVGLMESLALNRPQIETLLAHVETAGVDPMLVLERLAEDDTLDPVIDLTGRRRQVEQLLDL